MKPHKSVFPAVKPDDIPEVVDELIHGKSIVPAKHKAKTYNMGAMDLSGTNEIEEESSPSPSKLNISRLSAFEYYQDGEKVNNLAEYNRRRRDMLYEWEVPIPEKDQEVSEQQAIAAANALKTNACTGNLEISLFWEEKIIIIIRVLQLYAVFFIYYYESWPSKTRDLGTPYFMAILLSF